MKTSVIVSKTTPMQRERMKKHWLEVGDESDDLLIIDTLEIGSIRIYEATGPSVCLSDFSTNYDTPENTRLVLDAVISPGSSREEGVYIYKVSCIQGYETMIEPILQHILRFADFYGYKSVEILDREYDRWFHFAKKALAGFEKIGRVYECRMDG